MGELVSVQQTSAANPFVLGLTILMGVLLIVLPRRQAIIPIAIVTCYLTYGQNVVIAGVNFHMLRLLILFGMVRLLLRQEPSADSRWVRMDKVVLVWGLWAVIAYTLLQQSFAGFVNASGYTYDALGLYFICRSLVRDLEDIKYICRVFALLMVPLATGIAIEKASGQNPFYVLGGVPRFTMIRDGELRCQGPFRHPILAGSFGAAWLPLFVGLWQQGRGNRLRAFLGIASATTITFLSGSSGPAGTYVAAAGALFAWRWRAHTRKFRWAVVAGLVCLQMVMSDPVWFIFARMTYIAGGTGWHRANLIDKTVRHFFDWWLVGAESIRNWGIFAGDVTNQFLDQGLRGGVLIIILFTWIVVLAFSYVGRAVRAVDSEPRQVQLLVWAVGCSVFAHFLNFWNVSYFDQNVVNWYLSLAMSAAVFAKFSPDLRRGESHGNDQFGFSYSSGHSVAEIPALSDVRAFR